MIWPLHIAASDWEAVFWIIVGVIWFIAQLAAKAKKGLSTPRRPPGSMPRPAPSAPREALPNELEDFLRTLGLETPRPAVREPPAPGPVLPQTLTEPVVPAQGIRTRKKHKRIPAASPVMPQPYAAEADLVTAAKAALPEGAVVSMGKLRTMLVIPGLTGIRSRLARLPLLALQGKGANQRRHGATRMGLEGRAALRRAMINRLILEPPHAFKY